MASLRAPHPLLNLLKFCHTPGRVEVKISFTSRCVPSDDIKTIVQRNILHGYKAYHVSPVPYKVSHKPRSVYHRGGSMEERAGGKNRDGESDGRLQPKLLLMSGKKTERVSRRPIVASFMIHPKDAITF